MIAPPAGPPRVSSTLRMLLAIVALALGASTAVGDPCFTWTPGPFAPTVPGTDGRINAIVSWDPDGAGPQAPMLVIAGTFSSVDGIPVANVAAWDGLVWRALGSGIPDTVLALTVFNGELVAGGKFISAGGVPANRVAAWNGTTWHAFGDGIGVGESDAPEVRSLAVWNGELIAVGKFTYPCPGATRWDGSFWRTMSARGVYDIPDYAFGDPDVVCVFNNEIYVGGQFTDNIGAPINPVAKWAGDTEAWYHVEGSFGSGDLIYPCLTRVQAMTTYNGNLFVGGTSSSTCDHSMFRYDLNDWWFAGQVPGTVRVLGVAGGLLYAGGNFDACTGCTPASTDIAVWAGGTTWNTLGTGVGRWGSRTTTEFADALGDYLGSLVVGGIFDIAGTVPMNNLARWWGVQWSPLTGPTRVSAIAADGAKLALGGYFARSTPAGPAYELASWDGLQLSAYDASPDAPVSALYGYSELSGPATHDVLVVGGAFGYVGAMAAPNVAMHTQSSVFPFSAWSTMGAGLDGSVLALERYNGHIIAGGSFGHSGATAVSRIASFDGTSWQPMAGGMSATVRALKAYTTRTSFVLVAGGDFTVADGASANRVAFWTINQTGTPTPWQRMSDGFNGSVYALERYNGVLYAAGTFTAGGASPTTLNRIAMWSGSAWLPVGSAAGGGFDGPVYALKAEGGYLYAAGAFSYADGIPTQYMARWDGTTWGPVLDGPSQWVTALGPYHNELFAGGDLTSMHFATLPSPGVARLLETGAPWIAAQPVGSDVIAGQTVTLQVTPAAGYDGLTYLWRRDEQALADLTLGDGTVVAGSATTTLSLANVTPADSGFYDCVVTNLCGSATSAQAIVTVSAPAAVGRPGANRSGFALAIWPNPSHGVAEIAFRLPSAGDAKAEVLDTRGRLIRRLLDGPFEAGEHDALWDERDAKGRDVGPGVYFLRLSTRERSETRRMLVIR